MKAHSNHIWVHFWLVFDSDKALDIKIWLQVKFDSWHLAEPTLIDLTLAKDKCDN